MMDESQRQQIEQRLARLERELSELRAMLTGESRQKPAETPPPPPPQPDRPSTVTGATVRPLSERPLPQHRPQPSFSLPEHMRSFEYWLNKVGIGLVLFAVIFLFKYSIDQGWLTPAVRVGMGLTLGLLLTVLALRLYRKNAAFSLVLFGGGIATFYITTYAAFQWYTLFSFPIAFALLSVVAVFAIGAALKFDDQVFAVIGTFGGLLAPFLLYTGESNLPGLMTYTSILILAVATMYFFKSWRGLLWMTAVGGWIVTGLAGLQITFPEDFLSSAVRLDQISVQAGVIVCWLSFWAVPVAREVFGQVRPERFHYAPFSATARKHVGHLEQAAGRHALGLIVTTPLLALAYSAAVWEADLTREFWGWVAMGLAMVYGLVAYRLWKWQKLHVFADAHLLVGLLLLTISFALLFEGDVLLITLSTEALVLTLIARQSSSKPIAVYGYTMYVIVAMWLINRLGISPDADTVFFNRAALSELWAIATGFAAVYRARIVAERQAFLLVSFGFLAALLARDFEGNLLLALLSLELLVLHWLARRSTDRALTIGGHIFATAIGIFVFQRLFSSHLDLPRIAAAGPWPMLNLNVLCELVYAATLSWASTGFSGRREVHTYRIWLHVIVLALFLREFEPLTNGQGIVTVCWFAYALVLLIMGLRRDIARLRIIGMVTIALVIAKLFLVDLAHLETIWRILLFFGVGGVLLFVSYYFKLWWKKDDSRPAGSEQQ